MHRILITSLFAFSLPSLALADLNGSLILQANTAVDLDSGVTGASGGDFLWNGISLIPQTGARAFSVGAAGYANFGFTTRASLQTYVPAATATAIPAAKLTPGYEVLVVTTAGNLAKVFVADNTSGVITLLYTTFGATPVATIPVIYQVLNNSSGTPPLYPNYGVAPSSIILITGSGLSDPGKPVLQSSSAPGIQQTLNGSSVTVVVNGTTTHPALYYTSPGQLAAVLPAATPPGNGVIMVTYRGATSAPAPILVLASAVGINTFGINTAVATDNGTGAIITTTNSAAQNEVLTLWTTGLGADPSDSDTTYTGSPHAVATPLQIYLGGVAVSIIYQGASPYPGVDQIDITIPANPPTGCWVSLIAVTGSIISNATTLPVHPGGGVCIDSVTGLNGNQVSPFSAQTLRTGLMELIQSNTKLKDGSRSISNNTDGAFETYSGIYSPGRTLSPGGCYVGPVISSRFSALAGLSAGNITLTGPNNLSVALGPQLGIKGAFEAVLSSTAIPSTGGTFTFTGSGGSDVGPFTATVTLSNPLMTASNPIPDPINRTQGLPVSWTGGNPGTYGYVSAVSTSTPLGVEVGFTCLVLMDPGSFTVPAYVLAGVPAGTGGVALQNNVYSSFTATGLDSTLVDANVNYQAGSTTFR